MSNTLMTGRREERDGRTLLVFERELRAPLDDVWAACTEPSAWTLDRGRGAGTRRTGR